MASKPGGSTEEETPSVHTEQSLSEEERAKYGDYRLHDNPEIIGAYRQWWRKNPLNNLWNPKASLWRRFRAEVEGKTPAEASISGANLTLDDIKRPAPPPAAFTQGADPERDNLASDEAWFGTPDPAIYAEGTNALDRQQLAEERRKGNVVTLRDVRQSAEKAQGWELEAAQSQLTVNELQNRALVQLEDGSVVSLWDLYNYVHHNPELAALAAKGVNAIDSTERTTPDERVARVMPWKLRPNAPKMLLTPDQEDALPWGLLANGNHWSRKPTRWLKGLDGQRDFAFAVYAHEGNAEALLGPQWGQKAPKVVLSDPQFYRDVARAGPGMGLTVMAIASRQLPLQRVRDACVQGLAARLPTTKTLPAPNSPAAPLPANDPTPVDADAAEAAALESLQQLHDMFEPARLAKDTKLMDVTGQQLREGSKIVVTAAPQGSVLVQAVSPGTLREQESYVLGSLHSPQVTEAFVSLFANPETSIDPAMSMRAGASLLAVANGFRTKNANRNPNARTPHDPVPEPVVPGRRPKWALPTVGSGSQGAPALLTNVRKRVMAYQVQDAFVSAMRAAAEVPAAPDADPRAVINARRAAAEGALRRALRDMGVDASGVSIPPPGQEAEQLDLGGLFAAAAPLRVGSGVQQ